MTADPVRPQETLRERLRGAIHGARKWSSATPDEPIDAVLPIVEEETARQLAALRDKVQALADELRREAAKENETSRRQNATASGLVHAGQVVAKEDAARRLCALVEEPQGGEQ